MDGSSNGSSNSNSPAPFLLKTYEMVDDSFTNSVVSWSHTGHSFVVWNPPEFARDLLPKYFKHNNFSSFIRQLNTYGFRKIDPDQWEFANEEFIRGQIHLLKNIHRRKPIHSHSGPGNAASLTDSEREDFEKEIKKLKQEKFSLQSEIERHKQENQGYIYQLTSLVDTFQNIDHRQKRLISTMSQLLQKPADIIEQHSESHNKKRRLLASNLLQGNEDKAFQENSRSTSSSSLPLLDMENVEKLDSSLKFWEKFVNAIENVHDFRERVASSGDSDLNGRTCSSHSSPELAVSPTNYAVDSPVISSICIHLDSMQKPSGIDVNVDPTRILDVETPKDQERDDVAPAAGGNDVFWQQFLTDAPGCYLTREVQLVQRE